MPGLQLLTPVALGPYNLRNRVVMAPLTRMRSGPRNVPRPLNVEYYRQRASAGLIISEASPVSPFGHGYHDTPGIHTREQAEGWKPVVDAVHEVGSRMFLQLWHVGRMSHPDLQPGNVLPVGPWPCRRTKRSTRGTVRRTPQYLGLFGRRRYEES